MRRWFALLFAALTISGAVLAAPAAGGGRPDRPARRNASRRAHGAGRRRDRARHPALRCPSRVRLSAARAALSGVPRQHHRPRRRDARAVRGRPGVLVQGRHPDRRRLRTAQLRRSRRAAVRACSTCPPVRPPTAACGGTATATWCPTWCWSTRRPASTSRSGTCDSSGHHRHRRRSARTRRRRRARPFLWRARRRCRRRTWRRSSTRT